MMIMLRTEDPALSEQITNLEKLAKLATPGPWHIDSHGNTMVSFADTHVGEEIFTHDNSKQPVTRHKDTGNLSHWRNDNDATYIATANPHTILRLIERLRETEERLAIYVNEYDC
jgi:hypothetical protein